MQKKAIYPGTFDPITNGHVDLVKRCLEIFDEVVISVAPSAKKTPLFTVEERVGMAREATSGLSGVEVVVFQGLLVEHVLKMGGGVVIRGLRAVSDFEYEMQMALMNRRLSSLVETVFMMPSEEYSYLTSTVVKEVAAYGGDVTGLVPEVVLESLRGRFKTKGG